MSTSHRLLAVALSLALAAGLASAAENAALSKYGATITVTCAAPQPLNDRWSKPVDMLKDEKPAGPIINNIGTGVITISFPLPMSIVRVGIKQGDYRGSFAKAKDVTISAPGAPERSYTLENSPGEVQWFDYEAKAASITVRLTSLYPPKDEPARRYGSVDQVQVLVSEDLGKMFAPPAGAALDLPVFVMRTPNLDPQKAPAVRGSPRKATEHPLSIWDAEDIAHLKREIAEHDAARAAYDGIVSFCENACARPIPVPDKPDDGVDGALGEAHTKAATAIANLGIGYALSGREQYAREARRMLIDLADRYEGWPVHQHPKFTHDASKWSWQRLGDAIWLIPAAWGFDLIHASAALDDADRARIRDHFVMPCVRNIMSSPGIITAPTNWSAVCCAAVMIGARVSGDREFYEKSYLGLTRKEGDRKGGLFFHIDQGVDDDGMWAEGAIGYQFMAMRGLLVMAEILWRDGIDAYGYRDGRLKLVFDSPLWYSYPGGGGAPAIHDSGSTSLVNRDSHLYQYALRRYGDATYNAILHRVTPTLESVYNLFLPACEFAPVEAADLPAVPSILFPGVGFATVRAGDGDEAKYLLVDYGPDRSHGHPDKLSHCLFALGQELFADAGSAWYSTDVYRRYYSTTLAHNTVSANGTCQIMTGGRLEAYGSSGPCAIVRASSGGAIPCTLLDRTLVLSENRLYDVYAVRSSVPFTFDLPYHCHGELDQTIATAPWRDHPAGADGFAYYRDPVAASVDGPWRSAWNVERGRIEMHAMGEPGTQVVFAATPQGGDDLPTAMLRRRTSNTVFATVSDIVPTGATPSVVSTRSVALPDNAAYLLGAELAQGARELVMVNYTDHAVTLDGWTTDARVAFVRVEGGRIASFYLAGGTTLSGPEGSVTSDVPALVACRAVSDGLALIENQSGTDATLRISGAARYDAISTLARNLTRASTERLGRGDLTARLPAYTKRELTRGHQPTVAEHEERERRAKIEAALAAEAARRAAIEVAEREQYDRARRGGTPRDAVVLVQAEAFARQGGGSVKVTDTKTACFGSSFLGWDARGQWVEYDVEIPRAGWYQLVMRYCREGGPVTRSLQIDGAFPHESARKLEMDGTGGWSSGADNWKYYAFAWPLVGKPFLVELAAGRHTIRLENTSGGGVNLDYLVLAPPGFEVTRKAVEK